MRHYALYTYKQCKGNYILNNISSKTNTKISK